MADMKGEWWYPRLVDDAYLKRLRKDYPESAHLADDELRAEYECEEKYATLWDHIGDAYGEYEKVADRMLELEAEVERSRAELVKIYDAIGSSKLMCSKCGCRWIVPDQFYRDPRFDCPDCTAAKVKEDK